MKYQDIIIILVVVAILGLIIYFNFIRPRIKKESSCSKCAYAKRCNKNECNKNNK